MANYLNFFGSKAVPNIFILFLVASVTYSSSSGKDALETHSIFYGLALTASNRNDPGNLCVKQLTILENGLRNRGRWAIKMMDASGVPNTGLYWGNTYWMGSKKQCAASVSKKQIAVSSKIGPVTMETPDAIPPFPVDYYAAYFNHNSTMQIFMHWRNEMLITLGLCIPTSCMESDVESLLKEYFDTGVLYHQALYNMSFQMKGVKKVSDDYSWLKSTKSIVTFAIIGTFVTMCLLGTTYEIFFCQNSSAVPVSKFSQGCEPRRKLPKKGIVSQKWSKENESSSRFDSIEMCRKSTTMKIYQFPMWEKILKSFSLSSNAEAMFNSDGSTILQPLYGLRVFTMIYVILNHGMLFMADHFDNRISGVYMSDTVINQVFANSQYSVDTFFTISGFLLGHVFLREVKKSTNRGSETLMKNLATFSKGIIKRFLRLTPTYMTALCVADISATWRYRDTAFWSEEKSDVLCSKYWWRNILYINNFFSRSEMCMSWSWYLSNDMQFFAVCFSILILSKSNLKLATGILGGIFISSCLYTAYVVYTIKFIPHIDMIYATLGVLYDPPWIRIGPYIIGVAGAYILFLCKGKLPVGKHTIWLFWVVGVSLNLVTLLGIPDRNISLPASVVYVTLGKNLWAIGIVWMIIACLTDNGGPFQRFMSLKCWVPLSKISYSAYLINPIIIYAIATTNEKAWQLEVVTAVLFGVSFISLSFIAAFIFFLIIESPTMQLLKMFTDRKTKGLPEHENEKNESELASLKN